MNKICPTCAVDPTSHSFKKISEKNGIVTYYTQPSEAIMYEDREGILSHVDNALALLGDKKWICIINGDGFEAKHALEAQTGIGLLNLMTKKYGAHLQEIKIINPTWHIKGVYKLAKPFLDDEMMSKVKMLKDRVYSVLEFI
jgi:hypothetical protein